LFFLITISITVAISTTATCAISITFSVLVVAITHCRHCYGCLVGCCLSLFIGKGPVCIWKVRFAMDTRLGFRESFQKLEKEATGIGPHRHEVFI
jgi:hypothetical protein